MLGLACSSKSAGAVIKSLQELINSSSISMFLHLNGDYLPSFICLINSSENNATWCSVISLFIFMFDKFINFSVSHLEKLINL